MDWKKANVSLVVVVVVFVVDDGDDVVVCILFVYCLYRPSQECFTHA